MRHILTTVLLFATFLIVFCRISEARWSCDIDPNEPIPPPPATQSKRCIDKGVHGAYETLKDCLTGGSPDTDLLDCKTDPRYQLRNFAPFLNFPTIGSMLNLATGVVGSVAGILCGISMFYGAYRYLSAAGEEKKLESARSRMIYSVIGLVIVILAYSIVKIILDVTSTNTVGF